MKAQIFSISAHFYAVGSFSQCHCIIGVKTHRDISFNLVQNEGYDTSDIEISTRLFYQSDPLKGEREFVCPEQIYLAVPRNERYKNVDSVSFKDVENESFIKEEASNNKKEYFEFLKEYMNTQRNH